MTYRELSVLLSHVKEVQQEAVQGWLRTAVQILVSGSVSRSPGSFYRVPAALVVKVLLVVLDARTLSVRWASPPVERRREGGKKRKVAHRVLFIENSLKLPCDTSAFGSLTRTLSFGHAC